MTVIELKRAPRVLLADDDSSMRLMLATALANAGYEVSEAVNGAEAIETFDSACPDLVLLDVEM
ncbi:MAG: response regulator, partial [Gammaproteobacteria bacterium]|nr:response regulator [Gammaproteobacteria bacterium]